MSIDVRERDGVVILTPHGMLFGGKETDELEDRIRDLSGVGNRKLLINLGDTTFMSSPPLNELVRGHVHYAKRGARMKLCELDGKLLSLLAITHLIKIFDVYDTEEEALKSFVEPGEVGAAVKGAPVPSVR